MKMTTASLFLLLLLMVISPTTSNAVDDADFPTPINSEVLALLVLKSALHDPTGALSSWSPDSPSPCSWPHLQCSPAADGKVTHLSLSSLSLSGGPLPRSLSLLPSLRSLDLSLNSISGPLPSDLSLLPNLRSLSFSSNRLSGPIPSSLFSSGPLCSSLRSLDLSANSLSGPIPAALSHCSFLLNLNLSRNQLSGGGDNNDVLTSLTRLRSLDLSHNQLSGTLPESVSYLHNLKTLHLNGNRFFGPVPAGLGQCPHLDAVDLSGNSFDGPLPDGLRWISSLTALSLSDNQLYGELPEWLGNLTALRKLDLSRNRFTGVIPTSLAGLKEMESLALSDNLLVGAIPAELAECGELTEVRLKGNQLNGSIPHQLFDLGLEVLDLSSNALSGQMPAGSTRLSETLRALDLSDNRLTGDIPPEMALYFHLSYLNLSWNGLRTQLPPELGYFRNLSVLDLRSSELYGAIPGDLCDSGSLAVLQLDGNSLSGLIPDEIGNCSSLYMLSLSHNGLNGSIPAAMSRLKKLEILNLEYNSLSGEIPKELGTLDSLLAVNISHNRLVGRLPVGGVFHSLDQSALQGNLGLCSPLVTEPCKMDDVPKPLVLDPNAYARGGGDDLVAATNNAAKSRHRRFLSVSALVAISAALVIALGVLAVTLLNLSARRRIGLLDAGIESMCSSSARSAGPAVGKTVLFGPKDELKSEDLVGGAEALLSKATEIGRGAFGTVYRASIGEGGMNVAIKKLLTASIVQYHDDFDREVRILGKARHPNLMPIKGYYWTPQLQLLISDYAPNGSLHSRLHGDNSSTSQPLSWDDRFRIVVGTAKGLAHLHQSFRPPIIHYNVKPSNILLDEKGEPRISDFGLARLLPKLDKHIVSSRFQSAMGYVAPELACQSLRINEKCDIYGFGVVVLELVTGRRAVEYGEDDVVIMMDEVRAKLEQGRAMECVDARMGEYPEEEVLPVMKLGLVCSSQIPSSRPSMAEVVQILQVIKAPLPERMMGPPFHH